MTLALYIFGSAGFLALGHAIGALIDTYLTERRMTEAAMRARRQERLNKMAANRVRNE
jgi:hypothetical protein